MKDVTFSQNALRTLARIPANTARRMRSKVEQYAADPSTVANNVTALTGMPGYRRLRVGVWRVIFSEDGQVVAVTRIAPRGGAYE